MDYKSRNLIINKNGSNSTVWITMLLAIMCASAKYYPVIGIVITIVEMVMLLYQFFIRKNLYGYLITYITVVMTCMDNPIFAYGDDGGNLYSFCNMPLIRGYHTIIFACLPLIIVLSKGNIQGFKVKLREYSALRRTLTFLLIIYIWGIFSFLFSFFINDNFFGRKVSFYFWVWRKNFFNYTSIFALIISFSYLLVTQKDSINKIKNYLYYSLIGIAYAAFISFVLNWSGDYSNGTTLLLTQATFYIAFILLFPYYEDKSWIKCILIFGFSVFVMMEKASGFAGKWYLTLGFIIIVFGMKSICIKRKTSKKKIMMAILGVSVIGVGISVFLKIIAEEYSGSLAQTKLIQASMLFKGIGKEGWYEILPASPKMRIDEFINITQEYIDKPYYLLLGKGFSGTIEHHTTTMNWDVVGSTFSQTEISNGLYAFMHETPVMLFLMAGILGMCFIINEIIFLVKNWKKSVWVIIGIVWFMLFFNAGGFVSIYLGLYAWIIGKIDCKKVYEN